MDEIKQKKSQILDDIRSWNDKISESIEQLTKLDSIDIKRKQWVKVRSIDLERGLSYLIRKDRSTFFVTLEKNGFWEWDSESFTDADDFEVLI